MLSMLQRKIQGDFKAHWRQFLAAWVVVVMGTAFYGAFYPAGKSLLVSIYAVYDQLAYMDFQVSFDDAPVEIIQQVRAIPGVSGAEGRLVVESGIQLDPGRTLLTNLRLVSVPAEGSLSVNRSDIPEGRDVQADDEVVLLKRFADYHQIRPGDPVTLWLGGQKRTFKVAGLAFNPEYLVAGRSREAPFPAPSAFGVAWIRYPALAQQVGAPERINNVVVRLAGASETVSKEERARVKAELEKIFRDRGNVVVLEREQTASGGVIQANIYGNFQTMAMFSGLFLAASVVITFILLGRYVESERQRIGTLRALGVTRRELVQHYLTFGLLIGGSGGLVGSLAGYLISFITITPFVGAIAGGYLPGYVNIPQIPFILLGLGIVVGATILAGAYPAWVESATPPGIALRPPMPRTPSVLSRVSLHFLPLFLRQTLRNVLRAPGRSFATALGVATGTIMVFASVGLIASMNFSFNSYFDANRYDLRVLFAAPAAGSALEQQVRAVAGVETAQAALLGPVTAHSPAGDLDTLAFVLDEREPLIQLTLLEGAPAFASADGVWIGHNLARAIKLAVGDNLKLTALGQERSVKVLGIVSQTFGSPVFVPRSLFNSWAPGGAFLANAALVQVTSGKLNDAREALARLPGVVAVEDYAAFVQDTNDYLSFWRINAWAFAACGALLTLAVILNTINANLHEQKGDIAILRSLGVSRKEIVSAVLTELLLMTVLGIALGIPLGREVGFQMAHSVDMEFYGMVAQFQPSSIPAGVAAIVAIVGLASLPGLAAAFRVDLGQVSKGQSL